MTELLLTFFHQLFRNLIFVDLQRFASLFVLFDRLELFQMSLASLISGDPRVTK